MGKQRISRVFLDRFCLLPCGSSSAAGGGSSCLCFNGQQKHSNSSNRDDDEDDEVIQEKKPLITQEIGQLVRIRDVISAPPTLALHLKPKMVVLKVSMHCNGCARQVEKHISKMEGVASYEVDLETKRVVVIGDIGPFEVLESVSKVKYAQLWDNQTSTPLNPIL